MSLIEVAVSVLTVAVGSTLLIPALGEARVQSKEIKCLSNLQRLGEAASVHAAAHPQELAIPKHAEFGKARGIVGDIEWGGKSGVGEPSVLGDPLTSRWGTQLGRGPCTRGLNNVVYGRVFPDNREDPGPDQVNWRNDTQLDLDVFHCPADHGYAGYHFYSWKKSRLTSYDHYGNSYTVPSLWIGIPLQGCKLRSNSAFLRPVSRVPNPRNTVLFLENCGKFAWHWNYGIDGCESLSGTIQGPDRTTEIRGWHGRPWEFQTAFVDAHAGPARMEGHSHPQPQLAVYPDCDQENPADCYPFWRCAIIRGPGWQLDTLPSSPVPTDLTCAGGVAVIVAGTR